MKDDYWERFGIIEFILDMWMPFLIPILGGVFLFMIGLIDIQYERNRTQGKVRVASSVVSVLFWVVLFASAAS